MLVHQSFRCVFHLFLTNKECFVGASFSVCISCSSQSPICPSLRFPRCQVTGNEVFVSPTGGYEKGICFTVAGDGAAEGVTWGWNERQPSTREENYERIAAGFELRLIRSAGRRHRAGVFSHNMSSAEPQIGRPARRSDWLTCLSLTYLKEIGQSARPLYQSYDLSCLTQI